MRRYLDRWWHNRWALSLGAGLMLGLSFPPFPFPFPLLQFAGLLCLFRLLTLCDSARQAAYFSYPGFLLWNIIGTYWLMMASLAAGIAAILANAVLMALVFMLQYTARQRLQSGWLVALLQAAFWVSFEYLHHHWDLSWPWLSLGNAWSSIPALVQYISVTGFLGITFWVVFSSALLHEALHRQQRRLRLTALGVVLLFPVISLLQWPFVSNSPPGGESVETVIVQPNFDSYQEWGGYATPAQTLDHLIRLSDSLRTPDTQLIVWPENAIHPYLTNRPNPGSSAQAIKDRISRQAGQWQTTIIGGTGFYEYFTPRDHPPLPRWNGDTPFLPYNSAVGFYPDGRRDLYRKHNLVPVVERFPFVHFFDAVDVFGWVDWSAIQNYGKGYDADQFRAGPTSTPALICYDSVYPGWVRNFVTDGAGFITVITNDGWWGETSGHAQHFAYARLRALEFRRWVVRSANNGISGVIAPDGSVKVKSRYWTQNAFRYSIPVIQRQTFYTRYGDWLPAGMLVIAGGGILLLLVRRRNRNTSSP